MSEALTFNDYNLIYSNVTHKDKISNTQNSTRINNYSKV